jgi:hypothetical protein
MAIAHSDELRHSPAARDTKSSSRVIVIVRSLNNILLLYSLRNFILLFSTLAKFVTEIKKMQNDLWNIWQLHYHFTTVFTHFMLIIVQEF